MITHITNPKELNSFVALFGSLRPEDIISKLAENKVIVSSEIARIIVNRHNSRTD